MDGDGDADSRNWQNNDEVFVWDEDSQLYFHASTGFYHDPIAGWYYSSRDGLYYKFEDGIYVPLTSNEGDNCEVNNCGDISDSADKCQSPTEGYCHFGQRSMPLEGAESGTSSCIGSVADIPPIEGEESLGSQAPANPPPSAWRKHIKTEVIPTESHSKHVLSYTEDGESTSSQAPENPPPSEWLEETLIDLYLSGYPNSEVIGPGDDKILTSQRDEVPPIDGNDDNEELEEGEWIPEDDFCAVDSIDGVLGEGASWDEDSWRAQYGQVVQPELEPSLGCSPVDLWDWASLKEAGKRGKGEVTRLIGRLLRSSAKLHPSMPSGRGLFKTAPIREVHLDLVRVTTGKLYRLRCPSAGHLATISSFDASNPTKDWGFPELQADERSLFLSKPTGRDRVKTTDGVPTRDSSLVRSDETSASEKRISQGYRDRAAERRALHGGFGIGPGQKNSAGNDNDLPSSPFSVEDSSAEAWNTTFGAGSYARRMLVNMGWKEGEGLGKSTKGIAEPIQAVGNVGSAGLGWPQGIRKQH